MCSDKENNSSTCHTTSITDLAFAWEKMYMTHGTLAWLYVQDVGYHTTWMKDNILPRARLTSLWTLKIKMFTNENWSISPDMCPELLVIQRLRKGPCRIGVVLFPLVSKPTMTHSTQTLAGAEMLYFWSLHRVTCYDYLRLTAFDSFAATLWNPSILVQILQDFSLCFQISVVGADRHSMPVLERSTPTLFHAKKYVVDI